MSTSLEGRRPRAKGRRLKVEGGEDAVSSHAML
jgi:hypothetical protein